MLIIATVINKKHDKVKATPAHACELTFQAAIDDFE